MLRHALHRIKDRSSLHHLEEPVVQWRRFKTTGNPHPQQQFEYPGGNRKTTRLSRPLDIRNNTFRRPDFLQSLRVRKNNPTGDGGGGAVKPRRDGTSKTSSKLVHLLRRGHDSVANPPKSREPFPKPQSAAQSNLQGSTKETAAPSPGLVDFFKKRLEDFRSTDKKGNADYPERSRYGPRSHSHSGRGQPGRYTRPQSQRPGPSRPDAAGLNAAMKEAELARKEADTSTGDLSTVRQLLNQSRTRGITAQPENTPPKKEETMSPIRQYVAELQKKNRQKKEQQAENDKEPSIPSWRKSARRSSQNQATRYQRPEEVTAAPIFTQQPGNPFLEQWEREREEEQRKAAKATPQAVAKEIEVVLPSTDLSVADLSLLFRKKTSDIIKCLENMGAAPNDQDDYTIDVDMAEMVALELDIKFTRPKRRAKVNNDHEQLMNRRKATEESVAEETTEGGKHEQLAPRPPVVCIMGHVDHGKTTMMDALRRRSQGGGKQKKKKAKKAKKGGKKETSKGGDVAGTEAGGITQVISAFQVSLSDQKDAITFLDTPGHAAFSAMRQSGSHSADIIVLVVAADDGVSPQTIEILNFYKSIVKEADGGITMVVAMNKIDKPGVDVEESKTRIENQLLEHDIVVEGITSTDSEFGAPVQFIPISAKTGEGLDDLIEGLVLQSEVMDLRADDSARAEGIVMDARVEQGLGVVADCIVRWGSIEKGDVVISDTSVGKVRILKDVNDKPLKKGLPSQPVRIVGFKTAPKAGDPIVCVATEQLADDLVERRLAMKDKNRAFDMPEDSNSPFSQVIISGRESKTSASTEKRLERYDLSMEDTGLIRIPIVVKAKADGSVAAVRDSLKMLGEESSFPINIDPIAEGVGVLTMSEIEMAKESNAAVFCFDIKNQDKAVVAHAESEGVDIHEFDVIYSLLDHARDVFTEYLPSTPTETVHGKAKVQAVFSINNDKDKVAGLRVLDGHLYKSFADADKVVPVNFRVLRGGEMVTADGEVVTADGGNLRATSLKKFKEDVESVRNGDECGLSLTGSIGFREGDTIECYSIEMRKTFTK